MDIFCERITFIGITDIELKWKRGNKIKNKKITFFIRIIKIWYTVLHETVTPSLRDDAHCGALLILVEGYILFMFALYD